MAAAFGGPRPRDRKSLSCSRRAPVGVAATRARSDCHDGAESGERPMRNKMDWTSMDVLIFRVRWLARRPSRRTDGSACKLAPRRTGRRIEQGGRWKEGLIHSLLTLSAIGLRQRTHVAARPRCPPLITHHSLVATPKVHDRSGHTRMVADSLSIRCASLSHCISLSDNVGPRHKAPLHHPHFSLSLSWEAIHLTP